MSVSAARRVSGPAVGGRRPRALLRCFHFLLPAAVFLAGCAGPGALSQGSDSEIVIRPATGRETEPRFPARADTPSASAAAASPAAGANGGAASPTVETRLPAPIGERREHILQPGDDVRLEVFREPELSGQFRLSPDGEIRHPLLGTVPLKGLSVSAAEEMIRTALAEKYLVNPRVLLKLESTTATQIMVLGEVKNPGIITMPYGERLTLLEAIVRAGGFTPKAAPNRTTIVRRVDGKQTTLRVRVADMLSGRGGARDIPLEPNDVITVPEIWF